MPDMSGMDAAFRLRQMNDRGHIIFLTSTLEYAEASYDVHAFYYMLKPVDMSKLFKVLDNAFSEIARANEYLTVRAKGRDVRVKTEDIMYVELDNRFPRYYTIDGRVIEGVMLRGSFRELMEPLLSDSRFFMCGVSLLINLRYVDAADVETVSLRDGTQLFPPKSAYTAFRKMWKGFLAK